MITKEQRYKLTFAHNIEDLPQKIKDFTIKEFYKNLPNGFIIYNYPRFCEGFPPIVLKSFDELMMINPPDVENHKISDLQIQPGFYLICFSQDEYEAYLKNK